MVSSAKDSTYSPVQKIITLRDLQKVFSYVEHWSIELSFMLKRNTSIQNDENKYGNSYKAHKFVCTVIRTVEFYAWTILLTGVIYSFKLRNQEGNKSANQAE